MNQERLLKVLLGPHISEKSTQVAEQHRQIIFKVLRDATKQEIKSAVELLFDGVQVNAVRVLNVRGKVRRFGQIIGRRKAWKKAYVSLKEGSDIQFAGITQEQRS
jgi:large subunit ribosomal protein L23